MCQECSAIYQLHLREERQQLVCMRISSIPSKAGDIWDMIHLKEAKEKWKETIWYCNAPSRSCWFTYLPSSNQLPTIDRLKRIGVHLANSCFCNGKEEGSRRIFIRYPIVQKWWFSICKWFEKRVPRPDTQAELKSWGGINWNKRSKAKCGILLST